MTDLAISGRQRVAPGLRRLRRLLQVVGHIGTGLFLALRHDAFRQPHSPRVRQVAQRWQQELLTILGVRVTVTGAPATTTVLHVSNHVSWLDIPVIGALRQVHFLSKEEVRQWPVIGVLAQAAGTLFIRRGSGQSGSKAREIAAHLADGRTILVFPEGTTTDGTGVRRFFPALFQAPLLAEVALQPVALRYLDASGNIDTSVAFIGDDSFHAHLWKLLLRDEIHAHIHFCPAHNVAGSDHRSSAEQARADVTAALGIADVPRT